MYTLVYIILDSGDAAGGVSAAPASPGELMKFEQFEWDEEKRLSNINERGIDFKDAALIFEGPVIIQEDKREIYGEQRFRALGKVDGDYCVVAFTWRGSTCRIISAWKVDEDGRKRYEEILAR